MAAAASMGSVPAGPFFGAIQSRIGQHGGQMAYITGMVDQELLARNEYLTAENRILKAQSKGAATTLGRRASHTRRDWSSPGAQSSRRGGECGPTGHHPGLVP
jgi:hypothetical protein